MAWISVHTCVDGPKLRDLRKSLKCSKFEATGILVYLWFWGLENAEKDGRILNADKQDIEECFEGAGCKIPPPDIVEALIETRWIDETTDGFYIHDWDTWQDQWYKAKTRRDSDKKRKQESRRKKADDKNSEEQSADTYEESPADGPAENSQTAGKGSKKVPEKPPEGEEKPKYAPEFDVFWEVYPRKKDKGGAYKKYRARINEGFSPEELLTAAKNYSAQCKREGTEERYIKHAATFLSDTRPFTDYLPKKTVAEETVPKDGNPFERWGGGDSDE